VGYIQAQDKRLCIQNTRRPEWMEHVQYEQFKTVYKTKLNTTRQNCPARSENAALIAETLDSPLQNGKGVLI
jgi:hypothetical protein